MSEGKTKKILIADDGEFSRIRMSNTLITEGYSIKLTKDVDGTIEELRKLPFDYDLLLLNLHQSSKDSVGVLQWIKNNGRMGKPRVLAVLKSDDADTVLKVMKNFGVNEFVSKGITPEELVIRVNNILFSNKQYSERTRVLTNIPVDFAGGIRMLTGNMTNISETGAYICSREDFLPKEVLSLRFYLPEYDRVIEAEGEVVWGEKLQHDRNFSKGMGIQFTKIAPENKHLIASFVKKELHLTR